jgi:DNA-binding winged helix-turn-helix (wHTH) protein
VQHTVYLFDGFQLDVTRRKLISSGGLVQSLNSRAMDALLLLVENAGELVEKRRLMQTVWPNAIVEDNNLNQCILAIRKALGEVAGSNRYIMTVPGRGYRFVSPVRALMQESTAEAVAAPPQRWSARALRTGLLATVCTVLFAVVMVVVLDIAHAPADSSAPVADAALTQEMTFSGIVLRLREPAAAGEAAAYRASATRLAQCLMARPSMGLRVQLQLVGEGGVPVWTGEYLASAQDLLAVPVIADAGAPGCRDLITAGHP